MLIPFLFLHKNICCGEIRKILCGYPLLSVAMISWLLTELLDNIDCINGEHIPDKTVHAWDKSESVHFVHAWTHIILFAWCGPNEKMYIMICTQRRLRSACTSAQSDQNLLCLPQEILAPWLLSKQLREDSDQTAGMCRVIRLHWSTYPKVWFLMLWPDAVAKSCWLSGKQCRSWLSRLIWVYTVWPGIFIRTFMVNT